MNHNHVVTRIAPSPTGQMHIGTIRTALFNYLFAKHHGGSFIMRIEDTDKERSKDEWVDAIFRDLAACGLEPEHTFVQSKHIERHRDLLQQLVASDRAYISSEPAKNDPTVAVDVVRLRNPGTTITFQDLVRGDVTFDTTELGDFVIARSITDPLYHFAVVVDDYDEQVSHILRAEEHISNTPRQILIQEALGFERPIYAHLPLILAPDRSKLSKRHGAVSLQEYLDAGFLPAAILNYLALLGWNPGTDQEVFTLEELVAAFDITQVQKGGAVFDLEKFKWFNKAHLGQLPDNTFLDYVKEALPKTLTELPQYDSNRLEKLLPTIRERVRTAAEVTEAAQAGEYDFAFATPEVPLELLRWKKDNAYTDALPRLLHATELLTEADFTTPETIKEVLWPYAETVGKGELLWPVRVALTGREQSPDPFTCAYILGRKETLDRLNAVCDKMAT